MAGKRIGDHQVGIYKKLRTKLGQEASAAKAGISIRSARRLDSAQALPSQRKARSWRTRPDPFDAVWQVEIVPMSPIGIIEPGMIGIIEPVEGV